MSQMPPQMCPQCGTRPEAGQRFCLNCGATLPQPMDPTVAASGVASPYNNAAANPGYNAYPPPPSTPAYPGYANTPSNPGNPAYPSITPPPPQPGAFTQYNSGTVPPPAPIDPYSSPKPFYSAAAPVKKRSVLTPILIALAIIIVAAGVTGIFLLSKGGSTNKNITNTGGGGNNTYASSQAIDLTVTYASDQITFNNIQQAAKFADDSETSYSFNTTKNYVRLSFNEKQTATSSSYFSYYESFRLKLPNGSTVQAQKSEEFSGPESGVQRPNWADFPAGSGPVDLSNLTILLGTSDESQMTFPLKTGADVTKYQPKTFTLNASSFKYAGMDMTIKSVTQSYYYNGAQAKAGKVFLAIALKADNNQDSEIYLTPSDFLRLKTSDTTTAPDYSSDLNNFDIINPMTTGITGTAIFDVTPSADGKYTVVFSKGENFTEVDEPIQLS